MIAHHAAFTYSPLHPALTIYLGTSRCKTALCMLGNEFEPPLYSPPYWWVVVLGATSHLGEYLPHLLQVFLLSITSCDRCYTHCMPTCLIMVCVLVISSIIYGRLHPIFPFAFSPSPCPPLAPPSSCVCYPYIDPFGRLYAPSTCC